MQDSSRSLPPSTPQSAQRSLFQTPRPPLPLPARSQLPFQKQADRCQECNRIIKMESVDDLFCCANNFIDALIQSDDNREKNLKILGGFQDMTECQKMKIQQAKHFLQMSRELEDLKMTISANLPQSMSFPQSTNELSKWDCVDKATRFYNALSADQQKFSNWISWIDEKFATLKSSADENESLAAEVLCDFESDRGLLSKQEIVKVLEIENGNALVSGRVFTTERQVGQKFGLYSTLKSSIERQHRAGSGSSSQTCDSCRAKAQARRMLGADLDGPKITQQPLNIQAKLAEKAGEIRNYILSIWEVYVKETAQALMNLLFMAFKHWSREKLDVDYATIGEDMRRSLKSFFRSLEGSLSNDWECEIHYELILQQLRLLQSGDGIPNDGQRFGLGEVPSEEKTEKIGQLMLERRIIFSLLEKHQEMMQIYEAAKQSPIKPIQTLGIQSELYRAPSANQLERFSGLKAEIREAQSGYTAIGPDKRGSTDSLTSLNEGPELRTKGTMSESSLLSPPPPFDKPPIQPSMWHTKTSSLSKKLELASTQAKVERLEKRRYGSEPCILEATGAGHHGQSQASVGGRYRSADLSVKDLDKCSRIRARSFGQGGTRSLPRTQYPLPVVKKSPPAKLAVVHPVGGSDVGQEMGYVVIMRPNFRERITTVLDTKRRKRVSIHAAIERGIAGFETSPDVSAEEAETEEQLSEEEQKRRFYVYDTATGDKLNFDQALKIGIIHYDSSATESIVFDEYAKSEWRGVKSVYHPLVYRIEQVREVIERDGKLIRQKNKWMPFHQAVEAGRLDRRSAEYVVRAPLRGDEGEGALGQEILRLPFAKALAYGLFKVVPLRHCLIEKLPREKCIFA
ncbi:hypothetical protein Aperf_G00000096827 [Anoplocephala perfoliata]